MKSRNSIINSGASGKLAIFFIVAATLLTPIPLAAQTDPLPSWNDGATKKAIVDFVQATTDQSSSKFVPPQERIATFDQDGTLWVEHPMYSQVVYCLDRVPALVKAKPELADVEPFKTVLSGDLEAIAKLPMDDLESARRHAHRHECRSVPSRSEKLAGDSQGSALEAALHRADLPADERAAQIPAGEWLQDLHRHRRRAGLRARLRRGGLRHSARAGGRHRRRHDLRLRQGRANRFS